MKPHEITNIKRVRIWDALKGPIDRLIYTGVTEEEIETFVLNREQLGLTPRKSCSKGADHDNTRISLRPFYKKLCAISKHSHSGDHLIVHRA